MATRSCNNPNCKNQLDEHDAFCGACGIPANPDLTLLATNKQAHICGNCGNPLRSGKNFCLQCGTGTTLVVPGNTATICISCGHPRNQFQATCPTCNSQAPTMPAFNIPIVSILPANVPIPPLIIHNPSESQIYQATVSKTNPYANRGVLECEEYTENVTHSEFFEPEDSSESWTRKYFSAKPLKDATIQGVLQVTPTGLRPLYGWAGFLFRANGSQGYWYCLRYSDGKCTGYELRIAHEYLPSTLVSKGRLPKGTNTKKSVLLAVVMQQNILDLYVNLQHVERVHDSIFNGGFCGFLAHFEKRHSDESCKMLISNYKIWSL